MQIQGDIAKVRTLYILKTDNYNLFLLAESVACDLTWK